MKATASIPDGRAFTLPGLLIIIAILAILAAMLLPALAAAKRKAQRINCVNNLKQDALAFKVWAVDHQDKYPMAISTKKGGTMEWVAGGNAFRHFQVMSNELYTPKLLVCPSDVRQMAVRFEDFQNENLSYFVGLDANDSYPNMLLSGDRNIESDRVAVHSVLELRDGNSARWTEGMHRNQGNVSLADGSVQQVSTPKLQQTLTHSGDANNRIALPE